jgi:hypothetical protein
MTLLSLGVGAILDRVLANRWETQAATSFTVKFKVLVLIPSWGFMTRI